METGSGWPEDGRDINQFDLKLVDLHVLNTGPHPITACGVKSSAEEIRFVGTITDVDTVFLERVLGHGGGSSSSYEVIGHIDDGADVEWIQFNDATGQMWRLDRHRQLTPLDASEQLTYQHP